MTTGSMMRIDAVTRVAFIVLFAIFHFQSSLFTANQNIYMAKGLAKAGHGFLADDWFVRQIEEVPIFSALVSIVHGFGQDSLFYVFHGILAGIFAFALTDIAEAAVFKRVDPRYRLQARLVFFALFFLVNIKDGPLTAGLAVQFILGDVFQPSAFGVFFLLSLALYLRGHHIFAAVSAAVAVVVFPVYVILASSLVLCFIAVDIYQRRYATAAGMAVSTILLVAPIMAYVVLSLSPESAESLAAANSVLVHERIPHHTLASSWLTTGGMVKIGIMLAGLGAAAGHRQLLFISAGVSAVATALTAIQIVSSSDALALLYPWRASVLLYPLAVTLLLAHVGWATGYGLHRIVGDGPRVRWGVPVSCAIVVSACVAVSAPPISPPTETGNELMSLASAVQAAARPGEVYLVPIYSERFRIAAGVPIFVDYKSHPYAGSAASVWKSRIDLAKAYYEASDEESARRALALINKEQVITHIVYPADYTGFRPGFLVPAVTASDGTAYIVE
jgi:hypothetical protein